MGYQHVVEIHRLLRDYAEAGNGVLVVSSEMPELIGLCDRILVLHEGRLAGEVNGRTATGQELIHLATGSAMGAKSVSENSERAAGRRLNSQARRARYG